MRRTRNAPCSLRNRTHFHRRNFPFHPDRASVAQRGTVKMRYNLFYQERLEKGGCTKKVCVLYEATLDEISVYKKKFGSPNAVWSTEPVGQAVIL